MASSTANSQGPKSTRNGHNLSLTGSKFRLLLAVLVATLAYATLTGRRTTSSCSDAVGSQGAGGHLPRVDLGYAIYQPSAFDVSAATIRVKSMTDRLNTLLAV